MNVLAKDKATIERLYLMDHVRYEETIEKHDLLKDLLERYFPEALTDIFQNHRSESKFDMLENFENEAKHQYFNQKRSLNLREISDQIKVRMTFYSMYMIKDRNDMDHLKVKKLKYQLRNANQRIKDADQRAE